LFAELYVHVNFTFVFMYTSLFTQSVATKQKISKQERRNVDIG